MPREATCRIRGWSGWVCNPNTPTGSSSTQASKLTTPVDGPSCKRFRQMSAEG